MKLKTYFRDKLNEKYDIAKINIKNKDLTFYFKVKADKTHIIYYLSWKHINFPTKFVIYKKNTSITTEERIIYNYITDCILMGELIDLNLDIKDIIEE